MMGETDELEKRLAARDIDNADREIERLNAQIRALERKIRQQERIRSDASRRLETQ